MRTFLGGSSGCGAAGEIPLAAAAMVAEITTPDNEARVVDLARSATGWLPALGGDTVKQGLTVRSPCPSDAEAAETDPDP